MLKRSFIVVFVSAGVALGACNAAWAEQGKTILLPMRSRLSPVQKLNRLGVEAVKHRDYEKAEKLFYKAYLYDPADPFTLNNLGYVSELQGQLDKAQRFYELAAEQGSDANIDVSDIKHLQGKPMKSALVDLKDVPMHINRQNINAMRLLQDGRGFEALAMLKETLRLNPNNAFTLNNLGVASEAVGDLEGALKYYAAAASSRSDEKVIVTEDKKSRGHSVSGTAEESAKRVQKLIEKSNPSEAASVMYTLRGVYEANQNNWTAAREDFLHAYALDPQSAFSLNNRGYVAEHEGDLESAQFFYEKARKSMDANARVGMATDMTAENKPIGAAATSSNEKVDSALDVYSEQRHNQKAPVELTPRDNNAPAQDSKQPK
jgi:Flp pilus assembly protein TadD